MKKKETSAGLKSQIATMAGVDIAAVKVVGRKAGSGYQTRVVIGKKSVFSGVYKVEKLAEARLATLRDLVEKMSGKKEKKKVECVKCSCGCGEMCKPKRTFRQGHDARFHGRVRKLTDGRLIMADLKEMVEAYALPLYKAEL
jgi:hypothetical protein